MSNYAICMFAYNEATHITQSIHSVMDNVDNKCAQVFVIANGCTDDTVPLLSVIAKEYPKLQIVDLPLGDKCNAWNEYVHRYAPNVDTHFFVDADVLFSKNVFSCLHDHLQDSKAHVVAGIPISGRNKDYYRSLVVERSCFFGNLYGVKNNFLQQIVAKPFYLPAGLNWIDSFLTKAVNTDITFVDYNLPERVTFVDGHGYYFQSLSPLKIADLQLYKNRIARYELGKLQEQILDTIPVEQWPRDMHTINLKLLKLKAWQQITNPIKRYLVKTRLHKLITQGPKLKQECVI